MVGWRTHSSQNLRFKFQFKVWHAFKYKGLLFYSYFCVIVDVECMCSSVCSVCHFVVMGLSWINTNASVKKDSTTRTEWQSMASQVSLDKYDSIGRKLLFLHTNTVHALDLSVSLCVWDNKCLNVCCIFEPNGDQMCNVKRHAFWDWNWHISTLHAEIKSLIFPNLLQNTGSC